MHGAFAIFSEFKIAPTAFLIGDGIRILSFKSAPRMPRLHLHAYSASASPPSCRWLGGGSAWRVGCLPFLLHGESASRRFHGKCPVRPGEARGCANYSPANTSCTPFIIFATPSRYTDPCKFSLALRPNRTWRGFCFSGAEMGERALRFSMARPFIKGRPVAPRLRAKALVKTLVS